MGTNFYLKGRPQMVEVESLYHIAKTSAGWLPSFEAYTNQGYESYVKVRLDQDPRPSVHSVKDIKTLVKSGEYVIVDEYGDEYTWKQFKKRVLQHGSEFNNQSHFGYGLPVYTDEEGYEFQECEYC